MKTNVRGSFVKEKVILKNSDVQPIHQKWSTQLHNAITASRYMSAGKWSLTKWCVEFCKLNKTQDDNHIQQVLDWYCLSLKEGKNKYIPVCLSAAKFRTEFARVEQAMNKSGSKVLEIHPKVNNIVHRLLNDHVWSFKHKQELPNACQISFDNYSMFIEKFYDKAKEYRTQPFSTKLKKKPGLFPDLVCSHLSVPDTFVYDWFAAIAYKTNNPSWHGPLSETFDINSQRFHEWGIQLADSYGNSALWDHTLNEFKLKKEK